MAAQFELTLKDTDALLATSPASDPFTIDLDALGMDEGDWTLSLIYRDQYGTASEPAEIPVSVDAFGHVIVKLRPPIYAVAEPKAGGYVLLSWAIEPVATGSTNPANFKIVEASDVGTVLATVSYDANASAYEATVGPFTHGTSVTLQVRATDGGSNVTPWVVADPVTADSEGPLPPTIIEP